MFIPGFTQCNTVNYYSVVLFPHLEVSKSFARVINIVLLRCTKSYYSIIIKVVFKTGNLEPCREGTAYVYPAIASERAQVVAIVNIAGGRLRHRLRITQLQFLISSSNGRVGVWSGHTSACDLSRLHSLCTRICQNVPRRASCGPVRYGLWL